MTTSAGFQLEAGRVPGERIATTKETSDSSTFTTTETEVMSVTAALVDGRTYKVTATPQFASTVDDDLVLVRLREDNGSGTEIQRAYIRIRGNGNDVRGFLAYMEEEYTADATGNKTFVVTADRLTGSGDIHLEAGGTSTAYLYVDYIRD